MKFLQNYENIQNWIFLKTFLIRISQSVYKTYHAQKGLKFAPVVELEAKFYLYHSTKIGSQS